MPQELIVSFWMRHLFKVTKLRRVDRNLVPLMASYSVYSISVRLTRPLSLGIGRQIGHMHHLHIRQIQVFGRSLCKLRFLDASPCVKRGDVDGAKDGKRRTPLRCIDGDLSHGSYNHNEYTDYKVSDSEAHWMEFVIESPPFIHFPHDVERVVIHNRNGCRDRIVGCILELKCDGQVFKQWTVLSPKQAVSYVFGN